MRCLIRNMRPFKYATYYDSTEAVDGNNNYTGEINTEHSEPVTAYANISEATGAADVEPFGTALKYDKTLVMSNLPAGFDENTVLWIDDLNSENPDYIVMRIAKSLNFVTVAAMRKDMR